MSEEMRNPAEARQVTSAVSRRVSPVTVGSTNDGSKMALQRHFQV
jgi:hypothetical protein